MKLFTTIIIVNLIAMTLFLVIVKESSAESPSFSTQTISDYRDDWNGNSSSCQDIPIKLFPDISSATLISDGINLHATIWLNGKFDNPVNYFEYDNFTINTIQYLLYIDVHSFFDSGSIHNLSDYTSTLFWDPINRNWFRQTTLNMPEDFSENKPGFKILGNITTATNFYSESNNYVDLILNLDTIGSPERYLVGVQKYIVLSTKNHESCLLFDTTDGIQIPPPDLILTTSHNPIELRPGEEQEIEIQVKTPESELPPTIELSTGSQIKDVLLTLKPSVVQMDFGTATSILHIKAKDNASSHYYTIPVTAKVRANTLNYEIPRLNNISYDLINSNITEKGFDIVKRKEMTVNILPPITFEEKLEKFYNSFFTPINGIYGAISGILVVAIPWLLKRKRTRQRTKSK